MSHIDPDEFRRLGHEVIEWVARYLERVEELPVLSQVAPGDIRSRLPKDPPERGEPLDEVIGELDDLILPGITHWQSPNFFAFFPANSSEPAVLADLISSALGVNGMLWTTSPACTELETHVLDWLIDMLGLPVAFRSSGAGGGVIQDSASSATLCALLAARTRVSAGGDLSALRAYTSREAHSSVLKGARVAGLADDQVRSIDVDEDLRMRPDALAAAIEADRADGLTPFFVCATTGTTSTLAFDPVDEIGAITQEHGLWLHVDAAMAGSAAVCPELRWVHDGLERADSYAFNPHKWLLTTFDCDAFYVADRAALVGALSIAPPYLRNAASDAGEVIDYRDWQIPLGRRFRALKLWFVIRHYGVDGLREFVRGHVELTAELATRIRDDPRFELVAEPRLNLICFRHRAGDGPTRSLLDAINASGRAYLIATEVDGGAVIRICIGQTHTERRHLESLWAAIDEFAHPV